MSKPDIKLAESMLGTPYHAVAMNTIANQRREQGERDIEDRLDASAADIVADARAVASAERRKVEIHDELVAALRRAHAIERSVTQGQERELRVGYPEMLTAALAKAEAIL